MKLLCSLVVAGLALAGSVQAATITVAKGFGSGISVTVDGVPVAYSMGIGVWDSTSFTPFDSPAIDKGAGEGIGGAFAGVAPAAVNDQLISILVTTSAGAAILQTTANFPSDVSSALASSTAQVQTSANVTLVPADGISFTDATTLNFVQIPEPSVALLGALGLIGLVRRRR